MNPDKKFEPWPDDEDLDNVEEWGWWDETPYRVKVDGENDPGNVPTPLFNIMWERNPANRCNEIGRFDPDEPESECRWIMWSEKDYAIQELTIALRIYRQQQK